MFLFLLSRIVSAFSIYLVLKPKNFGINLLFLDHLLVINGWGSFSA